MSDIENAQNGGNTSILVKAELFAEEPKVLSGTIDPFRTVSTAIKRMPPVSLHELGEKYLETEKLDERGEIRKLSRSEVIVLVIEHFSQWLQEIGMGACVLNDCPHIFLGTHWQPIDDHDCTHLLGQLAERLGHEKSDSRFYSFREKLLKQMYSYLSQNTNRSVYDPILINFNNGTLEFTEGNETIREFRRNDRLNYVLPFNYDNEATCPMFDNFLLKVLPDPASRQVLSEFIGWLFLKDLKLEKALVLLGSGGNGKSVFFEIILALLGESNVKNLGLSSLSKPEKRFEIGTALINFSSEINDSCPVDVFKKMTSGEPIEARRLYKDVYTMRNYARLAFNANTLPKNTEQTDGYFRRFLIVPFTEKIRQEDVDPDLPNKIIATELSGVFNWVIDGFRRLRETRKFTECRAAEGALSEYRKESDTVALFLDESGLEASTDGKIGKDELYKEYKYFCTSGGYKSMAKNEFGKRLHREHNIEDSKSGSYRFWRIIRTEPE